MIVHHTPYKKMTNELTPYGKLCSKLCTMGLKIVLDRLILLCL
jgi:hypothetical protein